MKKKLKYILLLLLIIPCMFILSACGSKTVVDIQRSSESTSIVDIYTITYSDGTKSSFSVEKGQDGKDLDILEIYETAKREGAFTGSFSEFLDKYLSLEIGGNDNSEAINKSLMSAVSIYAEFNYDKETILNVNKLSAVAYGSGVIYKLDKNAGDAYIITNYHVVQFQYGNVSYFPAKIQCGLYGSVVEFDWITDSNGDYVRNENGYPTVAYSDQLIECELVGGSMLYDIAVLKVSKSEKLKQSGARQAVFADSNDIVVGQTAIAIGNPQNYGISATQGIICVDSEYTIVGLQNGLLVQTRVMRIDTAVNGGNSGGGLFNSKGEVIGIVNAKIVHEEIENIGYAIPSNIAKNVADNVIKNSGDGTGKAKRATIGITLEASNARSYYDEILKRVVVKEDIKISTIVENSLASASALKVGDRILSITTKNGTIQIDRIHHAVDYGWTYEVGDVVSFEIEGRTEKINILITDDCFQYID